MIKTIIFDRDGTLLDFSDMFLRFIHDIYEQQHVPPEPDDVILSYEFWDQIVSYNLYIGAVRVCDYVNDVPRQYMHLGKFYPDVVETIHDLRRRGLQMAIVSSWVGTKSTHDLVEHKGLGGCFDCILTQDDLNETHRLNQDNPGSTSVKEQLQKQARNYLEAQPDEILVVGDAPDDITAGKRMKMKTMAVMTGNGQKLQATIAALEPDWIVKSVANVTDILVELQNKV